MMVMMVVMMVVVVIMVMIVVVAMTAVVVECPAEMMVIAVCQDATRLCQPHRKLSATPPSKVYHCQAKYICGHPTYLYVCKCSSQVTLHCFGCITALGGI